MPWHCPACQTIIRHNEFEERPRTGVLYRCHVCRLELMVNQQTNRLTVVPLTDEGQTRERPTK